MNKVIHIVIILVMVSMVRSYGQNGPGFLNLSGPYLGQNPSGKLPVKFAPRILGDDGGFMAITFSTDGKECFFTHRPLDGQDRIITTKEVNGYWQKPHIPDFIGTPTGDNFDFEPHITPDDSMLIYGSGISNTGLLQQKYAVKTDTGWSAPKLLDIGVEWCMFVSVAMNGNMYFTGGDGRIYTVKYVDGQYQAPERLSLMGSSIEVAHPYIAPDESYIIYDSYTDESNSNLFMNIRNQDGGWSEPIKLDSCINTSAHEMAPFVSRDGRYLFFTRFSDEISIYWVSGQFIDELKSQE